MIDAILVVFVVVSILTLGGLAYFSNPHNKINKLFASTVLLVAIWAVSNFLESEVRNPAVASFLLRLDFASAALVAYFFLFFCVNFPSPSIYQKIKKYIAFIPIGALALLSFSSLIVRDIGTYKGGLQLQFGRGPLFWIYAFCLFGYMGGGSANLVLKWKKFSGIRKAQVSYVLLGLSLSAFLALFINLILSQIIGLSITMSRVGIYGILFFVGFTTYAIAAYRLMDITFTIRDTTLRLVSSLFPAVFFIIVSMIFFSRSVTVVAVILTAIASPFLYGPLRKLFRPVILGGKYDYQSLLRESTKALVSMLDLRQLLNYMVNTISESVGVDKISLFLKEESKRNYEIKASCGLDEGVVDNYVLKPNEGIIPWLKQSKAVFIKEEMERALPGKAFENIYGGLEKIGAEFILPLFYKDNLVGVLNLSNKQSGGMYNQMDIDILECLGSQAAVAIENARLHTEVITDELTGLYQPKYFELRLREEIEKAKRYRHCLSLMMVEIDNFEEFKKKSGEKEGNKLLKDMAGIVSKNLRMGDIACRCGEEGFGIILPEITEESRGDIRERLKKQIKETVEIGERLRRRVEEEELGVSISIGIASFDGQDREMKRETLIKQVREALSQARKQGNTVKVFYDEKLRREISTEVLEWIKETEETLVSGDLVVDLVKHTVEVKGKPVKLTPKAFDLLCLLMKKKGRVLNRSFLTESIWGYEYFGTTRTVDSHIKMLRQKLGSEGKKIKTIEGIGYKFTDEE